MRFREDSAEKKKLVTFLDEVLSACEIETEALRNRWATNQAYYNNDNSVLPQSKALGDGFEMQVFPFIQPRIDSISDQVVSAVCNTKPFLIGRRRGESARNELTENVIQFFWNIGKLSEALQAISPIVGVTNLGIMRQTFQVHDREFLPGHNPNVETNYQGKIGFAGLVFDVISPEDFICFPASIKSIADCQVCGHYFEMPRVEVSEMQTTGLWYETDQLIPTMHETKGRSAAWSRLNPTAVSDEGQDTIGLVEVYVKYAFEGDELQSWYKVIYAPDSKTILKVDKWEFSRPPYYDFRWKARQFGNFYPSSSIAQDLQGLAWQYCNLNNLAVYGAWFSALPVAANSGMAEGTQALVAGTMIGTNGGDLNLLSTQFNLSAVFPMIQQIETIGDSVCGMTKAGLAMASTSKTATQQMSEDAGQANRVGGYIRRYGDTLADMACGAQELLYAYYDVWSPLYMPEGLEGADLIQPMQWELQNQDPQASPMQKLTNLQMLTQMAMTDQQGVIQAVLQVMAQTIAQLVPDPKQADEMFAQLEAQVRQLQQQGLNMDEIKRTIVYTMGLPNADKILNEQARPDPLSTTPLSLPPQGENDGAA